jgi:hypothetical protein
MLLIGKPSISMGHGFHGYVSHNQRVYPFWMTLLLNSSPFMFHGLHGLHGPRNQITQIHIHQWQHMIIINSQHSHEMIIRSWWMDASDSSIFQATFSDPAIRWAVKNVLLCPPHSRSWRSRAWTPRVKLVEVQIVVIWLWSVPNFKAMLI